MKSAEETQIRRFVSGQLRDCPDLSTLTLGILRGRYLACAGQDSLNQENRQLMKRVVEEELLRMQDSDSSDNEAINHVTPTPLHNKRKRGEEEEKGGRTKADGSKAKRSRLQLAQSDSPDSGLERVGNGERQMAEEEGKDMESVEQVSQIGTKKNKGGHKGVHDGGKTETSSESDVEIKTVNQRKRENDSQIGTKKNKGGHKGVHDGGKTETSSESDVEIKTVNQRKRENDSQIGTKKNKGGHKGVHDGGKTETSSESDVEIKTVNQRKSEHDSEVEEEDFEENKNGKRDETHKQEKDKVNSESDSEEDKKRAGGKENEDVKVQSKCLKRREREPLQRRERVQVVGSDSEHNGEAEVMVQKGVKIQRNDNGSRSESEREKNDGASSEEASGGEDETKEVTVKTKDEPAQDSDSGSSLPSLEDEQESEVRPEQVKKRKSVAKRPIKGESGSKGGKDNRAVAKLRRYISLCGVRRNYKKLLDGCCSIKSKVAVLKRELEELGVKGQPSIEKCKKAKLKREEAQELADLDVCNIITTQGRPKRRGVSNWQQQSSPPSSAYKRVVNSSSDSEEDSHAGRGRKRATDWSNLRGIISDDADSN
ncbi:HIRA-interacting protein 3 isoform X2 [Oncorhynchus keta]|uniref:HIRA-interacting protein 3 isoform X2 n=2 Tax=Oncorhynchus keta TaxID=8018 RepID=UPI00227CBDBB|nr:HIRA-interacting protein 3 isoform X2 [Oncorhynchus keta]